MDQTGRVGAQKAYYLRRRVRRGTGFNGRRPPAGGGTSTMGSMVRNSERFGLSRQMDRLMMPIPPEGCSV